MRSLSRSRSARAFAALIAIVSVSACKDGPIGPKTPRLDGSWSGATSDGRSITFTVSGTTITQLSVGFRLAGSCYTSGVTVNYSPGSIAAITGRTFRLEERDMALNGTFSSDVAAAGSGSMRVSNAGPSSCSSSGAHTWSAHKL